MKAERRGGADGFFSENCTENTLIEKAKKGNREAFETLMKNMTEAIYSYISSHIGRYEDVKDILQETMLAVWNGLKSFDSRSSFKTWVIGITKRKIADYYRMYYRSSAAQLTEFESILPSKDEYDRINSRSDIEMAMSVLDGTEKN